MGQEPTQTGRSYRVDAKPEIRRKAGISPNERARLLTARDRSWLKTYMGQLLSCVY
jgi:hypothetical protein